MSRSFTQTVATHFEQLADFVFGHLQPGEDVNLSLSAEETLFLRINGNRVRQNTNVAQYVLSITMHSAGRTAQQQITLGIQWNNDRRLVQAALQACRSDVSSLPVDPFQVVMQNHGSSHDSYPGKMLPPAQLIQAILAPANGCDMVGFYAGGSVIRANRNSKGQSHWFDTEQFFFDYSIYNGPKAVKSVYAAANWNSQDWSANLQHSKTLLALLDRPIHTVKPGAYRTYMAPSAFADLVSMMGWNALSAAAWKQGRSPFKKLLDKELSLSPLLSVSENFGMGLTPRFNELGEVAPESLPLISAGELSHVLVSSRSAKEYGLSFNGANASEYPRALDIAPGSLDEANVLRALGTGMYLSNLHYLNWSDPVSARVTGMTRYACFWVEDGEIAGPIENMRWDESLFKALGPQLLDLTKQATVTPDTNTYFARGLGGIRTPGALIEDFHFTL